MSNDTVSRMRGRREQSEERGPLRDDLRETILARILSGDLAPGSRVVESRLCVELGISRTPLREALLQLEGEGFVRADIARGFTVTPLTAREVRELYPLLWTIEGLGVRLSGPILKRFLPDLRSLNAELGEARDPLRALELDTAWHRTLLEPCPNARLLSMMESLRATAERYERVYMEDTVLVAASVAHHQKVVDAIESDDLAAATQGLEANWRYGMDALLIRLGEP